MNKKLLYVMFGILVLFSFYFVSAQWFTSQTPLENFVFNSTSIKFTPLNMTFLGFDGVNDGVSISNSSVNFNNFTISFWVYKSTQKDNNDRIVDFQGSGPVGGFTFIVPPTVENIQYVVRNGSTLTAQIDAISLSNQTWHHILAVYQENLTSLWLNGVNVGNDTVVYMSNPGVNISLGKRTSGATNYWNGSIDEVRLYNVSLSPSQISEIYNSGRLRNDSLSFSALSLYFPFNENNGSVAYDLSSYALNSTISGASWLNDSVLVSTLGYPVSYYVSNMTNAYVRWDNGTILLNSLNLTGGNYTGNSTFSFLTNKSILIDDNYLIPPTWCQAIVLNVSNYVYNLTSNKTLNSSEYNSDGSCFKIQANNISINLNGYTLTGNGSGYGVYASSHREGINVYNGTLQNFSWGIKLINSSNVQVYNSSFRNMLRAIWSSGFDSSPTSNWSIFNNNIYNITQHGVILSATYNSSVYDNNLEKYGFAETSTGIWFYNSKYGNVYNNYLYNGSNAIYFEGAGYNDRSAYASVYNNRIDNMFYVVTYGEGFLNGITLDNASNMYIYNNSVINKVNGIRITNQAENNTILSNNFSGNYRGLFHSTASYNNFTDNDFSGASVYSVFMSSETGEPAHNNFYGNYLTKFSINISNNLYQTSENTRAMIYFVFDDEFFNSSVSKNLTINGLTNSLSYYVGGGGFMNSGNFYFVVNSTSSYILDNFNLTEDANRSNSPIIHMPVVNLTTFVNSSLTNSVSINLSFPSLPNSFGVLYPNETIQFFIRSNSSWFPLEIQSGDTYISGRLFSDIRISPSLQKISYGSVCSALMDPYSYNSESGCTSYSSTSCSGLMATFSNVFNYTLLLENYDYNSPSWSQLGKSCLFYGIANNDTEDTILIQAWRVASNGGQYCKIQNKWDWYVYTPNVNDSSNVTLTNSSFIEDLSLFYDNACSFDSSYILPDPDDEDDEDDGNGSGGEINSSFFSVDFDSPIYIVLFIIVLLVAGFLIYLGYYTFAGAILLLASFVLLFSGIGLFFVVFFLVISILIILLVNRSRG